MALTGKRGVELCNGGDQITNKLKKNGKTLIPLLLVDRSSRVGASERGG